MASKFKIGDLVWAKMKGFPAWPGKIIEPKSELKRPADKKSKQFVFFYGSENYAWVLMEQMWPYVEFKSKFIMTQRVPKGFKEAVECMEDVVKNLPHTQPPVKSHELPSIDDELAEIFDGQPRVPRKDTLSSKAKKKRAPSPSEMSNTSGSSAAGRRRKSTTGRKLSGNAEREVRTPYRKETTIESTVCGGNEGHHSEPIGKNQPNTGTNCQIKPTDCKLDIYKKTSPSEVRKADSQTIISESQDLKSLSKSGRKLTRSSKPSTRELIAACNTIGQGVFSVFKMPPKADVSLIYSTASETEEGPSLADIFLPSEESFVEEDASGSKKKDEKQMEKKSSPVAARDKGIFDMLGSLASQNKEEKVPRPVKKRPVSPAVSPLAPKRGKVVGKLPHSPQKSATSAASAVTSTTDPSIRDQNNAYDFFEDFLHSQGKKEEGDGVVPDVSPAHADAAPPKNVIATPMKIGFLGLGLMGSGMVNNLLISGHEVTVWNRTPSKCREFVKDCALKGNSPAEVVQQCDITFSCVSDPTALKDLVFGNCGVLQGISQGKAYVDMSTVDVDTITDVHEAVTARGGRFLEAPVIGSRQPSEAGSLIILAAGERSLYDDCYSCFEAMGRKTFYLGEIGSAAKMKLVTNMLMGTVLAGLAEALALAEKVGLEQDEVLQILELSPIACPFIKTKGQAMQKGDFTTHFSLENHQKDLRLAVGLADTVDQPLHVASSVNELFKKAKAKGYGEHDTAAVYRAADL